MSWRTVFITKRSKLDLRLGSLVIRSDETVVIPINEIHTLLVENTGCTITCAVLAELIKQKVKVIFCDEKHNPHCEAISYTGSHNSTKSIRSQISWSSELAELLWTDIVKWKIQKQRDHLLLRGIKQAELLEKYLSEIEVGDQTNREGHAAKVYFNALWGKQFSRDDENAINSSLDYGYSILLSAFNKEIVSLGYLTQLGIWHNNQFNPFNLSSDLMEPFRPLVDRVVYDLCPQQLQSDEKQQILSFLQMQLLVSGQKQYLTNAIRLFTKSVVDFMGGTGIIPTIYSDVV